MRNNVVMSSNRPLLGSLLGALLLLGACQSNDSAQTSEPLKASLAHQATISAKVVSVDSATRVLTLRRLDGTLFEVRAGEAVRNFAQIAVGDSLAVQYKETLDATRLPAGSAVLPIEAAVGAGRADAGAKPGVGVGAAVSLRVKVESIDLERGIVVFSPTSGELFARRLATDEGRQFAKFLKVGDTVQLDYAETLAVEIKEL